MRLSRSKRILGVGLLVVSAFSLWLISAPAQAAPPGVVIAAGGSDTTMDVMSQILTGSGEYNVLAGPNQSTRA